MSCVFQRRVGSKWFSPLFLQAVASNGSAFQWKSVDLDGPDSEQIEKIEVTALEDSVETSGVTTEGNRMVFASHFRSKTTLRVPKMMKLQRAEKIQIKSPKGVEADFKRANFGLAADGSLTHFSGETNREFFNKMRREGLEIHFNNVPYGDKGDKKVKTFVLKISADL